MVKSLFGLEAKVQAKAVLWIHFIENLTFYILSLALMMETRNSQSNDLFYGRYVENPNNLSKKFFK